MALVRKELIAPDRSRFPREDAFRFRHVLIQRAAYETLAKRTRARLHERHAAWLGRVDAEEELVGFHLEQAVLCRRALGLETDALAERAAEVLSLAGDRARKRSDITAAAALTRRAVALAPEQSKVRPRVLIRRPRVAQWDRPEEVPALAVEAEALAAQWGLAMDAAVAEVLRATPHKAIVGEGGVGALASAVATARSIVEAAGDAEDVALVLHHQSIVDYLESRPGDAVETCRTAIGYASGSRDAFLVGTIEATLGVAMHWGPTSTGEMLRTGHELLAQHRDGIAVRIAVLAGTVSVALRLRGAYDEARRSYLEAHGLAEQIGLAAGAAHWRVQAGAIALDEGDAQAALAAVRDGIARSRALGIPPPDHHYLAAQALIQLGSAVDAEAAIADYVADAGDRGFARANAQHLRGCLSLLRGDADVAVALLEQSLAAYRPTLYVLDRIRIGLDLAEALQAAGRPGEAVGAATTTLAHAEAKEAFVHAARAAPHRRRRCRKCRRPVKTIAASSSRAASITSASRLGAPAPPGDACDLVAGCSRGARRAAPPSPASRHRRAGP
jgi:tetratricopeptide (TPR) repeat protein